MAAELEALRRGEERRLIINLPPRNLKSLVVSVAFVAWLLGHDPTLKIICVSYGQELAENLARMCRQVMQSAWYRLLFPETRISPARSAAEFFETTAGGYRLATSIGGVLTGLGADFILIDDPVKPQEALSEVERNRANQWYRHTLITRLNDKQHGRIAMVMQRLHEDDMVGHVLQLEQWKVVALSAIAQEPEVYNIRSAFGTWTHRRAEGEALHPEREPLDVLAAYRRALGTEFFAAQFLQAPVPAGGNIVKIGEFQRFDLAAPPAIERTIHSWDTASKATQLSGFSVCTIWGIADKRLHLLDVVRARFEYPDLRAAAIALARGTYGGHRRPDYLLVEEKGSGQSLIQDLKRDGISGVVPVKPEADKATRMHSQMAVIREGRALIPTDAPWLPVYLHELAAFPNGRYDDQVDSTSQALKWFIEWQDEPGLIRYYRELVEKMKGDDEDHRMVAIRAPNPSINVLHTMSKATIAKGADGLFRLEMRDAQYFLRTPGWSLVEGPDST
jgi:predicted phage terminase large subunit-like protein